MIPEFPSVISLNDLRLNINLGVGEAEREKPQEISVSFKLFYKEIPKGCKTDSINDTICYFTISEAIREYCLSQEFSLLEYLVYGMYEKVRVIIPGDIKIWLMVKKNPPIENLAGGASFEYTDLWG